MRAANPCLGFRFPRWRVSSGSPGRKPVDRFRDGPVHVSIWENDGPRGAFRTASFELRYKNKQQEWQTSHSYGAADLEHVERVLGTIHVYSGFQVPRQGFGVFGCRTSGFQV